MIVTINLFDFLALVFVIFWAGIILWGTRE